MVLGTPKPARISGAYLDVLLVLNGQVRPEGDALLDTSNHRVMEAADEHAVASADFVDNALAISAHDSGALQLRGCQLHQMATLRLGEKVVEVVGAGVQADLLDPGRGVLLKLLVGLVVLW